MRAKILEISLSKFFILSPLGSNPTSLEDPGGNTLEGNIPSDVPVGVNFVICSSSLEFTFKQNLKAHVISKHNFGANAVLNELVVDDAFDIGNHPGPTPIVFVLIRRRVTLIKPGFFRVRDIVFVFLL